MVGDKSPQFLTCISEQARQNLASVIKDTERTPAKYRMIYDVSCTHMLWAPT